MNVFHFTFRNAVNFVIKAGAFMYSGSHSMFAEAIHSFADTLNQVRHPTLAFSPDFSPSHIHTHTHTYTYTYTHIHTHTCTHTFTHT